MSLVDNGFGPPHLVVEPAQWHATIAGFAHDGYTFFDWLSAVDEQPEGFRVVAHLARLDPLDHLLVATYLDREAPALDSITDVFAGAGWHERETHEMFGIDFGEASHAPLLLPDGFEGHPLRKEFVLASRVAKAWPGAKEPGESEHDIPAPGRRRVKPPGVPDPDEWGPDAVPTGRHAAEPGGEPDA